MSVFNIVVKFAIFALIGSLLFPGLDWLFANYVRHTEFVFHAGKYLIDELVFAGILTFLWYRWKKQSGSK